MKVKIMKDKGQITIEEAIEKLKRADITVGCKVKTKTAEAIEMAIKVLEREPILDKIRAEIKHFMYNVNPSSSESDYACNYILNIIDKYKAESEDKK